VRVFHHAYRPLALAAEIHYTIVVTVWELPVYSWDEAKNCSNQRKHGVSFEAATLVFDDPFHRSRLERIVEGEERWQTIGNAGGIVLLLVVHTWCEGARGEEHIRIISARRADRLERELYEEGA
jgi:uncharacterized protein